MFDCKKSVSVTQQMQIKKGIISGLIVAVIYLTGMLLHRNLFYTHISVQSSLIRCSESIATISFDKNTSRMSDPQLESLTKNSYSSVTTNLVETQVENLVEENSNVELNRGKFQQSRVANFCELHKLGNQTSDVNLGFHMLIDQRKNLTYCFVPKVGCTHLKIAFLRAEGSFPSDSEVLVSDHIEDRARISSDYRKVLLSKSSKNADSDVRKIAHQNYYKFMMYRNPAERLISSFRSKVEAYPLSLSNPQHFNSFRLEIFKYTQPEVCQKWLSSGGSKDVWLSFAQFIEYWLHLMTSNQHVNDHFDTIFSVCKPCEVRYNYYGNFKHFNRDAEILLRHQEANLTLLRQSYYVESGKTTRELAPEYYSQLSNELKLRILKILALDLRFYYNLFPEEEGSHKVIMETNFDVPEL